VHSADQDHDGPWGGSGLAVGASRNMLGSLGNSGLLTPLVFLPCLRFSFSREPTFLFERRFHLASRACWRTQLLAYFRWLAPWSRYQAESKTLAFSLRARDGAMHGGGLTGWRASACVLPRSLCGRADRRIIAHLRQFPRSCVNYVGHYQPTRIAALRARFRRGFGSWSSSNDYREEVLPAPNGEVPRAAGYPRQD